MKLHCWILFDQKQKTSYLILKALLSHFKTQKFYFCFSSTSFVREKTIFFFKLHDTKSNTRLKCDFRVLLNIICWIVSFVDYVIILREWARENRAKYALVWVPHSKKKTTRNSTSCLFNFRFAVLEKKKEKKT
jgi:hypothetical protein